MYGALIVEDKADPVTDGEKVFMKIINLQSPAGLFHASLRGMMVVKEALF
jgi:hypothetical protein